MIKRIIYILLVFLFIYVPPVPGVYLLHVLFAVFFLIGLIKKEYGLFTNKKYLNWLVVPAFIYAIYITYINDQNINQYVMGLFVLFVEVPFCAVFMVKSISQNNYDKFIEAIIFAGLIQSVISICAFFIPGVQNRIIDLMSIADKNEYITGLYKSMGFYRLYGWSQYLNFTMPTVQTFLAFLAVYYSLIKKRLRLLYVFFAFIMLFTAVINARLTYVAAVCLVGTVVLAFLLIRSGKKQFIKTAVFSTMALVVSMCVVLMVLKDTSIVKYNHATEGYKSIFNLLQGELTGYFGAVIKRNFINFPKGMDFLLGTGKTIYWDKGGSDIGYVNDIWLGGIIYLLLLYLGLTYKFKNMLRIRTDKRFALWMALSGWVLFLVTNIKGFIATDNEFIRLMTLIYCIPAAYTVLPGTKLKVQKVNDYKKLTKHWGADWQTREPLVSIGCITYNQEEYIGQAILSFLAQKTDFPFEILIHDDASTDKTPDIIREYEMKYPDIIKVIYQSENQYSKGKNVSKFNYDRARGKYYAFCEGDDFWIDPYKLQKQSDYMIKNENCSFVVHAAYKTYEDGTVMRDMFRPFKQNRIVSIEEVLERWLFATNSIMIKTEYMKIIPEFFAGAPCGDYPLAVYMAYKGSVYYIDEFMSAYRMFAKNSLTNLRFKEHNIEKRLDFEKRFNEMLDKINEYTEYKYQDAVKRAVLYRNFRFLVDDGDLKSIKDKKYKVFYRELNYKEKLSLILRNSNSKVYIKLLKLKKKILK